MKCTLCNERNGSTRCEGCQQLYCLPCMNKHHDELAQQFQSLTDARNELKQSINATESTSENNKEVPCIAEIDHWEQEIIQRIRNIAAKSRTTVNEIIAKNIAELQHRFEQISADIQQRQKDGNYLENDIDAIKTQLEQLRNDIEHVPKTIHVDSTVSTNTEWNTLIYVVEEDLPSKTTTKLAQTNDQSTKERKNKSYWNHLVELSEVTNSSPITTPNEQAAIGLQNPVQFGKTNSPSNLIDFEQKRDRIRPCIVCKHYFEDLSSAGLCTECDYHVKHPRPRQRVTIRSPATNIHPPSYRDSESVTPLSSSMKVNRHQKVVCPRCRNRCVVGDVQDGTDYKCPICQIVLPLPPH